MLVRWKLRLGTLLSGTRACGRYFLSVLGRSLSFWRAELAGLPEQIALPFDRARPAVSSYRGGSVDLRLSARLHGELLRLARGSGASLFMVLQAGVSALLTRLGGGDD